jgi:hypothetical protein
MSAYVFLGPTLPVVEARNWLNAIYLPPVSQGDIISLLRHKPKIIGIIDGYFDSVPSVWHKEILLALSRGVHVVGGASMGALRAAELHTFGMVGIGEIYGWYRDGVIEADDEVAIHHAPPQVGYQPLCEALVNMRKTLQIANQNRTISSSTMDALVDLARGTPYWERSYESITRMGAETGLPDSELGGLREFLLDQRVDLKKRDAIEVLRYIASLGENPEPVNVDFELHYTRYLDNLFDKDMQVGDPQEARLTSEQLVDHARLECDDFIALKDRTTINAIIIALARHLGMVITEEELETEMAAFIQDRDLDTQEKVQTWKGCNDLTEDEFRGLVQELALVSKVKALFSNLSNRDLLRQLRLEGKYGEMLSSALEREELITGSDRTLDLPIDELCAFYFHHKGIKVTGDIEEYLRELGFPDGLSLTMELQRYHAYHADR